MCGTDAIRYNLMFIHQQVDSLEFRRCGIKTSFQTHARTTTSWWSSRIGTSGLGQLYEEKESHCEQCFMRLLKYYFLGKCQVQMVLLKEYTKRVYDFFNYF